MGQPINDLSHDLAAVLGTQSDLVDALKDSAIERELKDQARAVLDRLKKMDSKLSKMVEKETQLRSAC